MPHSPLIGITCELEKHADIPVKDKNALCCVYSDAVSRAGGIPVLIPVSEDRSPLAELYDNLDGIMFSGSDDIHPSRYGQQPHPSLTLMPAAEFETWVAVLHLVLAEPKPLLAICGGMQVVNVALGGSLIQDLPSQTNSTVCHHSHAHPDALHAIDVDPGSQLSSILGSGRVTVNSAHHQAIDRLADPLTVTARCPDDGIIEAAEINNHPFLIAVQWHPERHFQHDTSQRLFSAFVAACRAK